MSVVVTLVGLLLRLLLLPLLFPRVFLYEAGKWE